MQQNLESEIVLAHVTVQVATISWQGVSERPIYAEHSLFQRLSDNHAPLRIGDISPAETLSRVGSMGFLPAQCSVQLYPIEKPLRVLYCFYQADFVEKVTQIPGDMWQRHAPALIALKNQRIEILMQDIYAEINQPGFSRDFLIESVTNLMLVELARHVRMLDQKKGGSHENPSLASWQLRRIDERIDCSPGRGYPSLAELAEICGISQGHLARSFKAVTGWQIHRYISEARMKSAKLMLAKPDVSCEEIASRLGFKSPAYFSTAFRRLTGRTPSQYRKKIYDVGGSFPD